MNSLAVLLVILMPFVIRKYYSKKSILQLYIVMVLQLILLLSSSPQYRFFLNFIIIFSLFLIAVILKNSQFKIPVLYFGTFAAAVYLLIPMNLNSVASNSVADESSNFTIKYIVYPAANSKLKMNYELVQENALIYHSPVAAEYIYLTGNGPLPCVNREQVDFYKTYFGVAPKMRTNELKDGFSASKSQQ